MVKKENCKNKRHKRTFYPIGRSTLCDVLMCQVCTEKEFEMEKIRYFEQLKKYQDVEDEKEME